MGCRSGFAVSPSSRSSALTATVIFSHQHRSSSQNLTATQYHASYIAEPGSFSIWERIHQSSLCFTKPHTPALLQFPQRVMRRPRRRLKLGAAPHSIYQMTQAELCRQKAIECEEEAKRVPSSFETEAWLKLAKQWRELAQRIENY
jgi:hypothetical protein